MAFIMRRHSRTCSADSTAIIENSAAEVSLLCFSFVQNIFNVFNFLYKLLIFLEKFKV